ncbi:hypothetical protein AVEN_63266-1 [Araneus ventricosus]|uniref:Uncharacterized protein n=1 Tax=Araneus ventricosus TaxID=182803 RepID=A0A4Y2XDZ4_ARAVE|nr:hypothetical protein AVEN_63266-1 [Araneus ventricosus]
MQVLPPRELAFHLVVLGGPCFLHCKLCTRLSGSGSGVVHDTPAGRTFSHHCLVCDSKSRSSFLGSFSGLIRDPTTGSHRYLYRKKARVPRSFFT